MNRLSPNFLIVLIIIVNRVCAQQVADTSFYFKINKTAYERGKGPVIMFDEFHNNPFTLKGQYSPFNKLILQDGYVLRRTREKVTEASLADSKIYVSVNALYDPMNWDLPTMSAYSPEEVDAIYEWVKNGGSLLLVTDHMPCPASVNTIAQRFGFNLINGFAVRKDRKPEVFSRLRGNLLESVITNVPGAVIDSIRIWGGTGFIAPEQATIINYLGDSYEVYLPSKASEIYGTISNTIPSISGLGLANGALLEHGKGRVFIFADGSPFSAQFEGVNSDKRGMNHKDASQNAQFLLNIIHWLDRKL